MTYPVFKTVVPLKLGILDDLRKEGHAVKYCRVWLLHHTSSPEYLAACAAPGSQRHDLQGNPVEPVSDKHRAFAQESLAKAPNRAVAGLAAVQATSALPQAAKPAPPAPVLLGKQAAKAASSAKAIEARRFELRGKNE